MGNKTITYKEVKDLTRKDTVEFPGGINRIVAGKSDCGTHFEVTFIGGFVAKLLRNQTMKIVGATTGAIVTPGYLRQPAFA